MFRKRIVTKRIAMVTATFRVGRQRRVQEFLKGGGGVGQDSPKRQVRRNFQTDKQAKTPVCVLTPTRN